MTDEQVYSAENAGLHRVNLWGWIKGRQISTPKGDPLTFGDSRWLADIYQDPTRVMAIVKSSQARISTYAIFRALHFALNNRTTTIFTEPTRDDAQKFSSSRVRPILNLNPWLLRYVTGGTELLRVTDVADDFTRVKSHVHFRGTFGEKEAFTIDADLIIIDERDISNSEVVETFDTRLIASQFKQKLVISTPSIPNYGVDELYQLSDQMTWLWECEGCNRRIDPRSEYYQCIDQERLCFRCPKCGRVVNRGSGGWVAKYPDRPIRGYAVTQPICLYVPVLDIVTAQRVKKPRKFANFWLGMPSEEGVATVTRDLILQKCFLSGHARSTEAVDRRRVMGVDQGNWLFYEVSEIGPDGRSWIVDLGHTREWEDLYRLMARHEIEVCVLDAYPEIRLARKLCKSFRGRVWMAEYANIQEPVRWKGRELHHILLNRTECLDAAAEDIAAGVVQLYTPMDGEIDEPCTGQSVGGWIQHWCNQHRVPPEEPGEPVRWLETGPDHRSHANAYRKVAESRIRRRPLNELWTAVAGERTFFAGDVRRDIAPESEIEDVQQPIRELRKRPVLDLRKGITRRGRNL